MGKEQYGIDPKKLTDYANEINEITKLGVEVAIVIGGGNIYRGIQSEGAGFDRVQGDFMGMLATIINGMALQSALEKIDIQTRLLTAIKMEQIAEPYIRRKAIRHLQKGRVVIFGGGTGNPYFTTDTAAALRAAEMNCSVIMKGTKVDGVYSSDPLNDDNAIKYRKISYSEVLARNLKVMDSSAVSLARDNNIPIIIFSIKETNSFFSAIKGKIDISMITT